MKTLTTSNKVKYPECWIFFVEQARNMEGEPESKMGKYRVPKPDGSGEFIYHNKIEILFQLLKEEWYKPSLESPSAYGKIQFIVNTF